MESKVCRTCETEKPCYEYYKDRSRKGGYQHWCKLCDRERQSQKKIKYKETFKVMFKKKHDNYYDKNRELILKKRAEYYLINKNKAAARQKVRSAIKSGRLIKSKCFCGENAEAHHPDYDRPLDVEWLCRKHHGIEHARLLQVSNPALVIN